MTKYLTDFVLHIDFNSSCLIDGNEANLFRVQALSPDTTLVNYSIEKIPKCLLREMNTGFVFCDNFLLVYEYGIQNMNNNYNKVKIKINVEIDHASFSFSSSIIFGEIVWYDFSLG